MQLKQILPNFDATLIQTNVAPVADQQAKAEFSAEPETNVVAHYCARDGGSNHQPNVQLLCGAGINGRGDKSCFARQWKAHAFQANDGGDRKIPKLRNETCGTGREHE